MLKRLMLMVWLLLIANLNFAQARELPDFADLAEKQSTAVVNISTTQTVRGQRFGQQSPFDEDDPAFEFFRRFAPKMFPPGHPAVPREFESKSLGSGFIISSEGYILTNAHVVDGADEVLVKLTDKREFKAKVIGTDKRTDVALIKIKANGLPIVRMGDPAKLRVGEWVVAIGSPFGFESTVTAGIVSAKGRSLPQENFVPFIQTDVAINPGNSGGPLFNMNGEVVGINSQIYSRTGGFMGLSFAIPIDVAMEVQSQLRTSGKVNRGRIGVMIQEVTKELADSFGLSKPQGALVAAVEKGGPADKAGLEAGDVILRFNDKPVTQSSDLPRVVGNAKPGSKATMQVWRAGASKELSLTVGEMTDEQATGRSSRGGRGGKPAEPATANRLGLVLAEPSAEQRRQLGIRHGLIVEEVRESSRGDLRQGDVILALIQRGAQTEIRAVDQFNGLLAKVDKGSAITLLVRRGDMQTFVTIKGAE
ncbi:MAG: DegQ family serine endoprotease [Gammaproteobacteria bacterium]|nr:DegQ family serine endoprotease [Rhodocyclaceae bacterium]MBU3907912.1 DegQ family serine endoprotease [Gammaproteobacteria bacterium]MBU4003818.1 DegQ family serine endoprotease [Gammaproteobacteria bacterium]MBU4021696.1 DegQ family serine endoprotease [Gammaproteobacteria bacterium]MBU4094862.1 DegQ family serine endoprotease [Gammaproteobacteria bacterium]